MHLIFGIVKPVSLLRMMVLSEDDFIHTKLTDLDLTIKYCYSFEELNRLFSVCPDLLKLLLQFWISTNDVEIVSPTEWQLLIEQDLVDLQHFSRPTC